MPMASCGGCILWFLQSFVPRSCHIHVSCPLNWHDTTKAIPPHKCSSNYIMIAVAGGKIVVKSGKLSAPLSLCMSCMVHVCFTKNAIRFRGTHTQYPPMKLIAPAKLTHRHKTRLPQQRGCYPDCFPNMATHKVPKPLQPPLQPSTPFFDLRPCY